MPTVVSTRTTPGHKQYTWTNSFGTMYNLFDPDGPGVNAYFDAKPQEPYQHTVSHRTGRRATGEGVRDDLQMSGGNWASATRSATRNPWTSRGSEHDVGHPFETTKTAYSGFSHPEWRGTGDWKGPLIPELGGLYDQGTFAPEPPSLVAQGVRAIRDTTPTRSPAALAQALIELRREGLPRVSRAIDSLFSARGWAQSGASIGSAHLTSEFGVKPLLRDVADAINVIGNGEEILRSYEDGIGKRQHRQRTFEPIVATNREVKSAYPKVTDFANQGSHAMGLESEYGSYMTTDRSVSYTDYFKGAYIYHLPELKHASGFEEFAEKYAYLTGMDPSYSLLWEVTPWSWLSDWVINIGDNIANAEALRSDGLVLIYGYMMRKTVYRATRTVYGIRSYNYGTLPGVSVTFERVRKERIRASPYGFGLNTDGFTARQWSILGALGLTKGDNSLRLSD